jgi:glycine dehydrogenase
MDTRLNSTSCEDFLPRHIGPSLKDITEMLEVLKVRSLDALCREAVPEDILNTHALNTAQALSERDFLTNWNKQIAKNKVFRSFIGQGYYPSRMPGVIQRNILENPAWYTAYTPYQAEISQGRMEMLFNYQTMITDLTGMEIANASLLDEATAAAEAMIMLYNNRKGDKRKEANRFLVDADVFLQTQDVLLTRAEPLGIEIVVCKWQSADLSDKLVFGSLLQYPGASGEVSHYRPYIDNARAQNVRVVMACDLLALALLTPPGELGADVAVGSVQRFGLPMGYGGPHAGYFATNEEFKRSIPGRIIGLSVDSAGKAAYRMALQTREQHIRREKATSNICTSQVLLAVLAAAWAVYHGPQRIRSLAGDLHSKTVRLFQALKDMGYNLKNTCFFDTLTILSPKWDVRSIAEASSINFYYHSNGDINLSIDECTDLQSIDNLISVFARAANAPLPAFIPFQEQSRLPLDILRHEDYLKAEVFSLYHSEHAMLRYLRSLETKDLSMVHSMIPLGSCTMKLNASSEMHTLSRAESDLHPFAPEDQCLGYASIIRELSDALCEITGFKGVSLQPNSGAQGEYAGLLVIRAWHHSRGDHHRNIALIPASAHGTNPASAVMAGMECVVVSCDEKGNISLDDLQAKIEIHKDNLSCLMVTYPSTHGVFESGIRDICNRIHHAGGQVYMDGANMNAQVGLTSPGMIGADVCHLNLHKTFAIPHGGGGPGVGPIGVAAHLTPFLPSHFTAKCGGEKGIKAVSAAPFGSAFVLGISYAYIAMMGPDGLKAATQTAILNANYLMDRLSAHYPVLYTGIKGRCAHEFILDCRSFKKSAGIEVEDIAKRLMDYGFHAPTVSFPVAGTLMIEPTESEPKEELDRFVAAMVSIRHEIKMVESGKWSQEDNPLKNAPHTAEAVMAKDWNHVYDREHAAWPLPWVKNSKFWPSVGRIDNAYGDRNLICSCS